MRIFKRKKEIRKKKKVLKVFFLFFSWSLFWSRVCFLFFFLDRYRLSFFSWPRACFLSFFSWPLSFFLFSWSRACFLFLSLSFFLFFLIAFLVESVFSFINSHLWSRKLWIAQIYLEYLRVEPRQNRVNGVPIPSDSEGNFWHLLTTSFGYRNTT